MNFAPADGPEPLRYVGEVFRTYILAERGDELCLIDKHAAHERQLYEKLAANYGNVPSQMLLEPTAIDLSAEEKQALLDHVPLLENAGWRSRTLAETRWCCGRSRLMWNRRTPKACSLRSPTSCSRAATTH